MAINWPVISVVRFIFSFNGKTYIISCFSCVYIQVHMHLFILMSDKMMVRTIKVKHCNVQAAYCYEGSSFVGFYQEAEDDIHIHYVTISDISVYIRSPFLGTAMASWIPNWFIYEKLSRPHFNYLHINFCRKTFLR